MIENLLSLSHFHDLAKIHDCDPVADIIDSAKSMTYKQKGQSELLLQAAQQVQDLCLDGYVQGTDRLITDDKLRIQGKCLGYTDTLPLSS